MQKKNLSIKMELNRDIKKGKRKPIFGVGVNDCGFGVAMKVDGKKVQHYGYSQWYQMLRRCFDDEYKKQHKTYEHVTCCNEWLLFSNFNLWWKNHYVEGWHLDKDILIPGNLTYSPEACVYVPPHLNNFVTARNASRGDLPIGVSFNKGSGAYQAHIGDGNGRTVFLGYFSSVIEAHQAWKNEKIKQAKQMKGLCDSIHPMLFDGLMRKVYMICEIG